MEILIRLVTLLFDLVFPWVIGYGLGQSKYRSEKLCSYLLIGNILFFWPLIGLISMWGIRLEYSLILLVLIGLIPYLAPGIIGWFQCRQKFTNPLDQGSYFLMALLPNNITIGFIASFILFGERGVALTQIITLCAMPVNFLISYPFGQYFGNLGGAKGLAKPTFKTVLFSKNQIPTLGILIGLTLNIFGVARPNVMTSILPVLIHLSAWAFLFPVGHSMKFSAMKQYLPISIEMLSYKFLITPIAVALSVYFLFSDPTIIGTAIVIGFSPVAIFSIVISQIYHLNYHMAITGVLVSHVVFSIIIFPILILLKDWLW